MFKNKIIKEHETCQHDAMRWIVIFVAILKSFSQRKTKIEGLKIFFVDIIKTPLYCNENDLLEVTMRKYKNNNLWFHQLRSHMVATT